MHSLKRGQDKQSDLQKKIFSGLVLIPVFLSQKLGLDTRESDRLGPDHVFVFVFLKDGIKKECTKVR